jgi:hypothetical protein
MQPKGLSVFYVPLLKSLVVRCIVFCLCLIKLCNVVTFRWVGAPLGEIRLEEEPRTSRNIQTHSGNLFWRS